eukprot:scaffold14918_cov20-Tisochrysis_lutea.AAC.3
MPQGQQLKRDQVHWKQWNRQFITIQGSIVRSVAVEDEGFQGPALAVHLLASAVGAWKSCCVKDVSMANRSDRA